jgi:hypothetical protein
VNKPCRRPPVPWVAQHVEVSAGTAYGVIHGDIHVFGDGGVIYLLARQPASRSAPVDVDSAALEDLRAWRSGRPRLAVRWLHAGHLAATGLASLLAADSAGAGWLVVHAVHEPVSPQEPLDHEPPKTARDSAGTLLVAVDADHWPPSHIAWLFNNRILFQDTPARILLTGASEACWPGIRGRLANVQATTSLQRLGG